MNLTDYQSTGVFVVHEPEYVINNHSLSVVCHYSVGKADDADTSNSLSFTETFEFVFPETTFNSPFESVRDSDELAAAVRHVAIAAAPSYYKATVAPTVTIDFSTSTSTNEWARSLFDQGLREFRFSNNLDLERKVDLSCTSIKPAHEKLLKNEKNSDKISKCLVPIGGGKDSITTLEVLSRTDVKVLGFSVGVFDSITKTANVAGIDLVRVTRTIDPQLFDLNKAGAPNGHVPVTAITSSLAVVAAVCVGADSVAMSNEKSADEPTRVVGGIDVNHQWSKSYEAEVLLRNSLNSSGIGINYFSLLRPLSEYYIFSIFAQLDQFHDVFTSCNRVFTIDKEKRASSWCGDCDKCRFVFVALCAFRDVEYVSSIFSKNLFDDESQTQGFLDLIAVNAKPFECVGTIKESRIFIRKALRQDAVIHSVVGQQLVETITGLSTLDDKTHDEEHSELLPANVSQALMDVLDSRYRDFVRSYIGSQHVGVVGLGRDTAAMIRFLDRNQSVESIDVYLPEHNDVSEQEFHSILTKNNVENVSVAINAVSSTKELKKHSVVFVSPGISRYDDDIAALGNAITTPLFAWFQINHQFFPTKTFIGVTGTKGKSTTASMIHHVLDSSIIVGNLGIPAGDTGIVELYDKNFVILEVSSFQGSYFTESPDVVVVTSLFDCHIDWHRTPENYRRDKLNLALHSPAEIVASDTIDNFAPLLRNIRKENDLGNGVDVISLVPSAGLSLLERNHALVREVVTVVLPAFQGQPLEKKLASFEELKYRQEHIASKNGVLYISDVLSSAPLAALNAIDDFLLRFPNARIFLLCGGAHRDVDLDEMADGLNARGERVFIISLPETGHMIEDRLTNFHHSKELADGVAHAAAHARPGDIVLLAPGAPSFHRYENYTKLAEHFEQLVGAL